MNVHKKHRTRRELLRDYSLYLLISLAFMGLAIGAAHFHVSENNVKTWGSVVFVTPFLFGILIASSRALWKQWQFWAAMFLLLGVHLGFFALLFDRISNWRGSWTTLLALPEFLVFQSCQSGLRRSFLNPRKYLRIDPPTAGPNEY